MALETLNGVKKVGDFNVVVMDELREQFPEKFNESGSMDYKWFEKDVRPHNFIYVRKDVNSLSFTLQRGPVKENGVNGCQVDTVIEVAMKMLEGLNAQVRCAHNDVAIECLSAALDALNDRKKNRIGRGVEGTHAM